MITATINKPQPELTTHAQRISQGGRTVYYLSLRMSQFDSILPSEVDANVIKVNRRFVPTHAKDIENYLRTTDGWLLGPVTLSIDSAYVNFTPFAGQDTDAVQLVGELEILEGGSSELRILDGQHRRRAIKDFRAAMPVDLDEARRLERLNDSQMPVALYLETDTDKIRQMFADMAQQRRMDAVTTARFDARDPFNRAANDIREQSEWLKPYVEMDASTVSRSSTKILAFNQLVVNLKTLRHGYGGRVSRQRLKEAEHDFPEIVDLGLEWVDEFLPAARKEYLELARQEVDEHFVPSQKSKTLAYNATMIRIFAGCYYEWGKRYAGMSQDRLAEYTHDMDLRPTMDSGPLVNAGVMQADVVTPIARRQLVLRAINNVVDEAHKSIDNQ